MPEPIELRLLLFRVAMLALFVAGCGRLGFSELEVEPDAGIPPDAGPEFRFEPPVAVDELSADRTASIDDPTLTGDRLQLLFNRETPSNDVFGSVRASVDDPWPTPTEVAELSSAGVDSTPKLSSDGLEVTLGTSRGPGGDLDLYGATRSSLVEAWSTPTDIVELNSDDDEFSGTLSTDRLRMYFSRRDGNGITTVHETQRPSLDSPWQTPVAHDFGTISATDAVEIDQTTVVLAVRFADDNVDLVIAQRADPQSPFAIVEVLDDVNSSSVETDPWLAPDGSVLYFTSSRTGTQRIYRAERRR